MRKPITSLLMCAAASGFACNGAVDAPRVDFGVSQPVGRWELDNAQSRLGDASVEVVERSEVGASGSSAPAARASTGPSGNSGAGKANAGAAGRAGAASVPAADSGNAGTGSKQSAEAPAGDETSKVVTSLTFNFSTEPIGGRYKPKNIGAVWITDSSGKLVKSLEVWAFLRLRYLTKYASARAGARTDVTSSATLPNHNKAHTTSWDLKDTTGATVPPGKYTLNAEITDQDATGKNISVQFDTSAGPMTSMPPSAAGFTTLELILQ